MANNSDILGEEAAVRQIVENDFSATDGVFEDDSVTTLRGYAFTNKSLVTVNFPNALSINGYAFIGSKLRRAYIKKSSVDTSGFNDSQLLSLVDMGGQSIANSAFVKNRWLQCLALRSTTVVSLNNVNAFDGTPYATSSKGGSYVYVPRSLISSYQTASNWSTLYAAHSDMFRALEDYTVDGTTTGDLKEALIFPSLTPIYTLTDTTFNGTSDYIDTNLALYDSNNPRKDLSFVIDFTMDTSAGRNATILYFPTLNANNSITFSRNTTGSSILLRYNPVGAWNTPFPIVLGQRYKAYIISHGSNGLITLLHVYDQNGNLIHEWNNLNEGNSIGDLSTTLVIGKNPSNQYFKGTIHKLKIYKGLITEEQALEELGITGGQS